MSESFDLVVGRHVAVEVINRSAVDRRLFPNYPATVVYEGEVLMRTEYDPKDAFRLTGDELMPIRVISRSHVVGINGTAVPPSSSPMKPLAPRIYPVKGSKGADYTVTITSTGAASCTCSGYGFRRKCSHIDGVLASLNTKS